MMFYGRSRDAKLTPGGKGVHGGRGEEVNEVREVTETFLKRRSGGTEDYGELLVKEAE
jgi:hypothetical protein